MVSKRLRWELIVVVLGLFALPGAMRAQSTSDNVSRDQVTSTVQGGSGLFNTLSTRSLKRGEFTFGVMWNNFDRDPGDLDINQLPVNLTFGIARRWEVFANWNVYQQVTSRQPLLVSAPLLGVPLSFGLDPVTAFGPGVQGSSGAAFFPRGGAPVGGILPALGDPRFSALNGLRFSQLIPAFFNDFPFSPGGNLVFVGGRPFLDFRRSANGTGDVTLGTKVVLRDPDTHIFSFAVMGMVRIPTASGISELSKGRGTGETDWGAMLLAGQEVKDHRLRFYENFGFTKKGDPESGGLTLIDLRDELTGNVGVSYAASKHVELISEFLSTVFVGNGTPNLNPVNPLDFQAGARFHFWDGRFSFGGAYRLFLNQADDRTYNLFGPANGIPTVLKSTDPHGFVVHLAVGRRIKELPPPPPPVNHEPTVTCSVSPAVVAIGVDSMKVALTASGSDPDNDVLIYRWTSTAGTISGDGPNVTLDLSGASPGSYSATVSVDDGKGGKATCTASVMVQEKPNACPSVRLTAEPSVVTEGDNTQITLRAAGSDPDGDALTYTWFSSRGQVAGSGATVTLDSTGFQAGTVTVRVTASDGKCPAQDSATITVKPLPVKPTSVTLTPCHFKANNARVDNECKRFLQDAAQRLQQDPRATLDIDGHSDKGESKTIAQKRAENAKTFMVEEMKIDANRIVVRSFGNTWPDPSGDRKLNRRIVITIVPEGAEMPE